jgi:hypothetical protein
MTQKEAEMLVAGEKDSNGCIYEELMHMVLNDRGHPQYPHSLFPSMCETLYLGQRLCRHSVQHLSQQNSLVMFAISIH